jgi:hypothetical protein
VLLGMYKAESLEELISREGRAAVGKTCQCCACSGLPSCDDSGLLAYSTLSWHKLYARVQQHLSSACA